MGNGGRGATLDSVGWEAFSNEVAFEQRLNGRYSMLAHCRPMWLEQREWGENGRK